MSGCRKLIIGVIVLLFSCCSVWYIAIQIYRSTLTSFEHFETEEQVETYFKKMWAVKKTRLTQVMSDLERLTLKNCVERIDPSGTRRIHCTVLAPTHTPHFDGINTVALHNLYVVYYYYIYIYFKDDVLDDINVYLWSSFPAGSF